MSQIHIILSQNFVALFIIHFRALSSAHQRIRFDSPRQKVQITRLVFITYIYIYAIISTYSTSYIFSAFIFSSFSLCNIISE